jgi:hypothetical protein
VVLTPIWSAAELPLERSSPVVRTRLGFHADDARRQIYKEPTHLAAVDLTAHYDFAVTIHHPRAAEKRSLPDRSQSSQYSWRALPFPVKWLLTSPLWHIDAD